MGFGCDKPDPVICGSSELVYKRNVDEFKHP